jgi:hypothetical protein
MVENQNSNTYKNLFYELEIVVLFIYISHIKLKRYE